MNFYPVFGGQLLLLGCNFINSKVLYLFRFLTLLDPHFSQEWVLKVLWTQSPPNMKCSKLYEEVYIVSAPTSNYFIYLPCHLWQNQSLPVCEGILSIHSQFTSLRDNIALSLPFYDNVIRAFHTHKHTILHCIHFLGTLLGSKERHLFSIKQSIIEFNTSGSQLGCPLNANWSENLFHINTKTENIGVIRNS